MTASSLTEQTTKSNHYGVIHTAKTSNYTQVHNGLLNDERLSFRAIGIACYLLSKTDGWRITHKHLANVHSEGRDAVLTGLRELEDAGYLVRNRIQDRKTGKWRTESRFADIPFETMTLPERSQPSTGKPGFGVPTLLRKTLNTKLTTNNIREQPPRTDVQNTYESPIGSSSATCAATFDDGNLLQQTALAERRNDDDATNTESPATTTQPTIESLRSIVNRWLDTFPRNIPGELLDENYGAPAATIRTIQSRIRQHSAKNLIVALERARQLGVKDKHRDTGYIDTTLADMQSEQTRVDAEYQCIRRGESIRNWTEYAQNAQDARHGDLQDYSMEIPTAGGTRGAYIENPNQSPNWQDARQTVEVEF